MAERRMFAKTIVDSDAFLEMPLTTQALYFHLAMRADDDGFINNPKKIQRMVGCSEDDLKLLLMKNFLIAFETGVVVIKHWRIHNYLRNDRYKPTVYTEEKSMLILKDNGSYTKLQEDEISDGIPIGIPSVNQMETQYRLGKESIGKDSLGKDSRNFVPPTAEEVIEYAVSKGKEFDLHDAEMFIGYYESKNWKVGKDKMTSWHGALSGWIARDEKRRKPF